MPLDDTLGGAGAAPGSFTVVSQTPTILVQGASSVVDAMTITINVTTVQVVASFTVPRTVWALAQTSTADEGIASLASQYAAYIEALGEQEAVVGISYAQDVNAAGYLIDVLIVTVATADGSQSAIATVPFNPAALDSATNTILAAYNNLLAVAALT